MMKNKVPYSDLMSEKMEAGIAQGAMMGSNKPMNQVDSLETELESLREVIKRQNEELLQLYRSLTGNTSKY